MEAAVAAPRLYHGDRTYKACYQTLRLAALAKCIQGSGARLVYSVGHCCICPLCTIRWQHGDMDGYQWLLFVISRVSPGNIYLSFSDVDDEKADPIIDNCKITSIERSWRVGAEASPSSTVTSSSRTQIPNTDRECKTPFPGAMLHDANGLHPALHHIPVVSRPLVVLRS